MRFYLVTYLPVLLAVVFAFAGAAKLLGAPGAILEFEAIGIGQWFRYFTGVLEIAGAAALLFPKSVFWAALDLAAVMAGATAASLTVLHVPEMAVLTAALMVAALTVAYLRKPAPRSVVTGPRP
jgi:putative oxidoreductase